MFPVYTIGHSTRSADEFIGILQAYGIELLADIRTIPRSRRNPQFETETLRSSLTRNGIEYVHLRALGGLRHPKKDSINTAWRNDSFRGYADYMQTEEFAHAIDELIARAARQKTAIMCAEAVPWRCHRSLVADALLVRGVEVIEIMSATSSRPHALTKWATVDGTRITYPGPADCATME
ncbi:MAG TPA: DUF488 domain-containing protein [Bryobacteraceae bacterium]|jgi:uncharacterized protein (DUF488 family)|nr:DUF488 domain-containing protein [Bryobacteraceae bacterium]